MYLKYSKNKTTGIYVTFTLITLVGTGQGNFEQCSGIKSYDKPNIMVSVMVKCGGWESYRQCCWSEGLSFSTSVTVQFSLNPAEHLRRPGFRFSSVSLYRFACMSVWGREPTATLFPQGLRETGHNTVDQMRFSLPQLDDVMVCVCVCV